MRPSSSYATLRKGEGEEGKQQSNGAERKGQTRIKEPRSIARTLCVGCPVAARPHTLHLNCTPTLPAALSHRNGRRLVYAQRMDQLGEGRDLSWKMRRGEERAGLDGTGLYAGGNAMSHLKQAKPIHSPCPPSFRPRPLVEIPCWWLVELRRFMCSSHLFWLVYCLCFESFALSLFPLLFYTPSLLRRISFVYLVIYLRMPRERGSNRV